MESSRKKKRDERRWDPNHTNKENKHIPTHIYVLTKHKVLF